MLWLALHLPWLPLEALAGGATAEPAPAAPAAGRCVVEQRCICVTDAAAGAAGIVPGMAAATARALQPGLQLLVRQRAREADGLHLLALALSRFTPHLVLRPNGLQLEVAGSLRLFGGPRALLAQVQRTVAACGHRARVGIAPTAGAAWLFAQVPDARGRTGRATGLDAARERLDALPLAPVLAVLEALEAPGAPGTPGAASRLAALLQGVGCRCLRDVQALPRSGLQRRGGGSLLSQLDAAYGRAPAPQVWFEPPRQFKTRLELLQRADDAGMLGFAAQRLVQALAGWLTGQWLAAAAFSLWLQHETTGRHALPPTRLRIELGQPSRDAAHLGHLLRERLQRCALPAAVYGLELELDEAVGLAGREGRLPWGEEGPSGDADDVRALLDRLSARLGPARVQRLQLRADHRPERAAAAVPAVQAGPVAKASPSSASSAAAQAQASAPAPASAPASASSTSTSTPASAAPAAAASKSKPTSPGDARADATLPRPAWLLAEPLRLGEAAGRPLHGGPLELRTKAERIEAGWFDGALACRDYHVAEGADHRLRWIFSERRGAELRWFLHGLFG